MTKAAMISFIPIIVIGVIFASYVALTPQSTTIYSMPPPNTGVVSGDGWRFTALISQYETGINVSANMTYVGSSNATYYFGAPLILCQIEAQNGTIVWSEVTTMLLRIQPVTPGQTFSDSAQVPTSQLVLGQEYTLVVYPQISGNGYSGSSAKVSFSFSPLAVTSVTK